jgi:hypothetical protein
LIFLNNARKSCRKWSIAGDRKGDECGGNLRFQQALEGDPKLSPALELLEKTSEKYLLAVFSLKGLTAGQYTTIMIVNWL